MKHVKQRAEPKPKADRQPAVMPLSIDALDKDAYERAISWVKANGRPDDVKRLDAMLQREGFEAAGRWAAYAAQYRTLGLRPWMCPPMDAKTTDVNEIDECYGWRRAEVTLRARLEAAGLSIYEPLPIEALRALGHRAS
jgi:hypothetical protein